MLQDVKHGVLPRVVDVVNLVLTKKAEAAQCHSATTLRECAIIVSLQWVRCNVFPCSLRSFERRISEVLAKNLNVPYPLRGTRVRCIITQDIVDMINEKIDNL